MNNSLRQKEPLCKNYRNQSIKINDQMLEQKKKQIILHFVEKNSNDCLSLLVYFPPIWHKDELN